MKLYELKTELTMTRSKIEQEEHILERIEGYIDTKNQVYIQFLHDNNRTVESEQKLHLDILKSLKEKERDLYNRITNYSRKKTSITLDKLLSIEPIEEKCLSDCYDIFIFPFVENAFIDNPKISSDWTMAIYSEKSHCEIQLVKYKGKPIIMLEINFSTVNAMVINGKLYKILVNILMDNYLENNVGRSNLKLQFSEPVISDGILHV